MSIFDLGWFTISFIIIGIVLLIDPKSSMTGASSNAVAGLFASQSSVQQFIYKFSASLITLFFILTTVLSLVE